MLHPLGELKDAGIPTYAFLGPLLPHFATQPELLEALFERLVDAGVSEVFMDHVNLKRYIRERHGSGPRRRARRGPRGVHRGPAQEHRERLDGIVADLLAEHGLRPRFDEVVHHPDGRSWTGAMECGSFVNGRLKHPAVWQSTYADHRLPSCPAP
ncbi:hypothetical protein [Streptomyces sp. 8K308]|uniref:hypothetical protein n=1 Tax=Streptomyces sp. 8K308 TaxID=2530388 RepID=UPI001FB76F96|nr:hypothetical protein [Streptomyces sp. 8K308]